MQREKRIALATLPNWDKRNKSVTVGGLIEFVFKYWCNECGFINADIYEHKAIELLVLLDFNFYTVYEKIYCNPTVSLPIRELVFGSKITGTPMNLQKSLLGTIDGSTCYSRQTSDFF